MHGCIKLVGSASKDIYNVTNDLYFKENLKLIKVKIMVSTKTLSSTTIIFNAQYEMFLED